MIGQPAIKVITGQRRSGKSFLLQSIVQQYDLHRVVMIDFELKTFDELRDKDKLYKYIKQHNSHIPLIAIDEIQECVGREKVMVSLLKEFPDTEIWITGSNSSILANDLTTNIR